MTKTECFYCTRGSSRGLMICCERCLVWLHYRCVNKKWDLQLNRRQLHLLNHYYCYPCRRLNPSLKLKYYSSDNINLLPIHLNHRALSKEAKSQPATLNLNSGHHQQETQKKAHVSWPPGQDIWVPYSPSPPPTSSTSSTNSSCSATSAASSASSSSSTTSAASSSSSSLTSSPSSSPSNSPDHLPRSPLNSPDEAIENKQPNRLKSNPVQTSGGGHQSTKESHHPPQNPHKQQQQQQQQQQKQPKPSKKAEAGGKVKKKLSPATKRSTKEGRKSELRSRIRKAMQRHPELFAHKL